MQMGRDNHYLDCELMIHTAAMITGLVQVRRENRGRMARRGGAGPLESIK